MKTFEITNGDLSIGQGGYAMSTGSAKLRQDLSIAVREPYGSDRFHPRWGSLLSTFVGQPIDPFIRMKVVSEVQRVIGNYVSVQKAQISTTSATGRRPTFGTGEAIGSVQDIQVRQTFDRLNVKVLIRTLSGESVSLISTVGV